MVQSATANGDLYIEYLIWKFLFLVSNRLNDFARLNRVVEEVFSIK